MSKSTRKRGSARYARGRILTEGKKIVDSRGNVYIGLPTSVAVDILGRPVGRNYTLVKVHSNK